MTGRRSRETRACAVCESLFHPWEGRPGLTCSRPCGNIKKVVDRWADHDPTQIPDYQRSDGYWVTYRTGKKELLHRVVMSEMLDRPLLPGEVVHHYDLDPGNNDPSNLRLKSSQSEHISDEHGRPCDDDCTCGRHNFTDRPRRADGTFLPAERTA